MKLEMTKRTSTDISKDGAAAMSREDRKNEAIMRMIERQEQQRKKREEKKKLAVSKTHFLTLLFCFVGS